MILGRIGGMVQTLAYILAALDPDQEAARRQSVIWLAILMVVVLIGGSGIMWLRHRMTKKDAETSSGDTGFSLSDLRAMRDRGEITPEEFEVTRAKLIAKVKGPGAAGPTSAEGK